MKLKLPLFLIILTFSSLHVLSQSNETVGIIPLPVSVNLSAGKFTIPQNLTIQANTPDELNVADFLKTWLQQYGKTVSISNDKNSTISLSSSEESITNKEGYNLSVSNSGIKITASQGAGLFYGVQSLIQLVPIEKQGEMNVPFLIITDQPFFKWRGVMLDVSRHFFSVGFVKKYIDVLATYKINTFHWHLTDDQGWRIEIKKYPKLTEIAAFRKETLIGAQQLLKPEEFKYDGTPYGGFYTQDEIREVVAYAQKRYITIVPEIEMPGHSVGVLAAYPELACKQGDYETYKIWGVSEDIICPSDKSVKFFENVLAEVIQLFPGKYVHIGGDEAPKTVWKESAAVKKLMKKNDITDVEKMQGWFNARIEKFLISKGKQLVGWDEILEGGIAPSSVVMSWRGEQGGIEAAKHGNDVVMSPNAFVYFDYGQNPVQHSPDEPLNICCYLPIEKVYNYNPIPKELSPELRKHILGTQSTLFTEYITTDNKAEYMIFPRVLAIAEVGWTPAANKNFQNFYTRLGKQFPRLDNRKIFYRIPETQGLDSASLTTEGNKKIIKLSSIVPGAE
ncbi:MAG: beta-N-acetylhexosaminidase, partial [Daejeonella sp.]|nr:beta-N-acetylhexosaminidase [Daejeonella sp.]